MTCVFGRPVNVQLALSFVTVKMKVLRAGLSLKSETVVVIA
jgi:hypothetical protein